MKKRSRRCSLFREGSPLAVRLPKKEAFEGSFRAARQKVKPVLYAVSRDGVIHVTG